jgi:hypothetical protein
MSLAVDKCGARPWTFVRGSSPLRNLFRCDLRVGFGAKPTQGAASAAVRVPDDTAPHRLQNMVGRAEPSPSENNLCDVSGRQLLGTTRGCAGALTTALRVMSSAETTAVVAVRGAGAVAAAVAAGRGRRRLTICRGALMTRGRPILPAGRGAPADGSPSGGPSAGVVVSAVTVWSHLPVLCICVATVPIHRPSCGRRRPLAIVPSARR